MAKRLKILICGFPSFFMLSIAFMVANQCYAEDAHISTAPSAYSAPEISKRSYNVPGPMVVTEFSPNNFVYELQRRIEEEVNKIIDQEIDHALKRFNKTDVVKDFARRFVKKERLWITLYYLGKMDEHNDYLLVDALTDMQKHDKGTGPLSAVKISDRFDFFGSIKELVIKIDDEKEGLTSLRAAIKDALLHANEVYKKLHGKQLYDPSFSEQHRYEPHITFGHLSSTIAHFLEKNSISPKDVMDKIFDRIQTELPELLKLTDNQRTLKIDTFQLNAANRTIVKKFKLSEGHERASKESLLMGTGQLPSPTGKYTIGTAIYYFTDKNRHEPHSQDVNDNRELTVQVWYPAEPMPHATKAWYINPLSIAAIKENLKEHFKVTVKELSSLDRMQPHAYMDGKISKACATYPVIIFSPGFGSPINFYTSLLEELASHGYIVVAIAYPYVTDAVILSNGKKITAMSLKDLQELWQLKSEEEVSIREQRIWVDDIRFIVKELEQINNNDPQNILTGKLDLQRLGMFGHSFGGGASLAACRALGICKAVADLDGKPQESAAQGFAAPALFVTSSLQKKEKEERMRRLWRAMTGPSYYAVIKDALHGSFTDLFLFIPWKGEHPLNLDPTRGIEITRASLVGFFDKYLKSQDGSLKRISDQFPELSLQIHHAISFPPKEIIL